jgi:hypothetical protein
MRLVLCAVILCIVGSQPAAALVHFDFEERFFSDPIAMVADHAIVQKDSLFHLFYTRGPVNSTAPALQTSIGHATSPDLIRWTIHPPVLPTVPGTWESLAHWAPMLVELPAGVYNMFYTGVDSNFVQQIGLATSTDLFEWTPSPLNPIFHPDTSWASWSPAEYSNCRDPFVWMAGDTAVLLVTTLTSSGRGAIGSAVSTDLVHWTDTGPAALTPAGVNQWHQIEASFVTPAEGRWQMYYGETNVPGIQTLNAPAFGGPWDLTRASHFDYGAAPEIFSANGTTWFSRHATYLDGDSIRSVIRFDPLVSSDVRPYVLTTYVLPTEWTASGSAFVSQPTYGDNTVTRGAGPSGLIGNCWIGTHELFQGALVSGIPGLTQSDFLTGDLTSHTFVVTGDSITLLVGGGSAPDSEYVALCDACTDSILRRETGRDAEAMDRRVWDVRDLRGQSAYIRIADYGTRAWGHINCDEIEERLGEDPPAPVTSPAILLRAPLAGALLTTGDTTQIAWSILNADTSTTVSVYLSLDGGHTYPRLLGTVPAGDSLLRWIVDVSPTGTARFRLIARTGDGITACDRNTGDVAVHGIYIQRVTVANVTDSTATIFWTTRALTNGRVEYGPTPDLGLDAEQSGYPSNFHTITLHELSAGTTYYFRVHSQDETADNGEAFYSFQSAQQVVGTLYCLTGTVLSPDSLPAGGATVLVWLTHDGVTSFPLLASTNSSGIWNIDLQQARDPATGLSLPPRTGDSLRIVALLSPTATIVLNPVLITGESPQQVGSLALVTGVEQGGGRAQVRSALAIERVAPTPARKSVTVAFRIATASDMTLRIVDVRGQLVRTVSLGRREAGAGAVAWDGRDGRGQIAPSGVYYAIVTAGPTRAGARVLLLR